MGGTVILLKNENVAQALISFAREYAITHLVLGRPAKRKLLNYFKPSLHETLIQELRETDIVMA